MSSALVRCGVVSESFRGILQGAEVDLENWGKSWWKVEREFNFARFAQFRLLVCFHMHGLEKLTGRREYEEHLGRVTRSRSRLSTLSRSRKKKFRNEQIAIAHTKILQLRDSQHR